MGMRARGTVGDRECYTRRVGAYGDRVWATCAQRSCVSKWLQAAQQLHALLHARAVRSDVPQQLPQRPPRRCGWGRKHACPARLLLRHSSSGSPTGVCRSPLTLQGVAPTRTARFGLGFGHGATAHLTLQVSMGCGQRPAHPQVQLLGAPLLLRQVVRDHWPPPRRRRRHRSAKQPLVQRPAAAAAAVAAHRGRPHPRQLRQRRAALRRAAVCNAEHRRCGEHAGAARARPGAQARSGRGARAGLCGGMQRVHRPQEDVEAGAGVVRVHRASKHGVGGRRTQHPCMHRHRRAHTRRGQQSLVQHVAPQHLKKKGLWGCQGCQSRYPVCHDACGLDTSYAVAL